MLSVQFMKSKKAWDLDLMNIVIKKHCKCNLKMKKYLLLKKNHFIQHTMESH